MTSVDGTGAGRRAARHCGRRSGGGHSVTVPGVGVSGAGVSGGGRLGSATAGYGRPGVAAQPAYTPCDVMPAESTPVSRQRRQRTWVRDFLEVVLIALVLYVGISFAFQTVRVDGESMVPTLQNHDLLLGVKFSYHLHDPERGDIIVLKPPQAAETRDFIKRIIALPGDTIEIDGNYVDPSQPGPASTAVFLKPGGVGPWQKVAEPYLPEPWVDYNFCCLADGRYSQGKAMALTIPKDRYFVMGDNRNRSSDSRLIGLIPRQNIIAKAWFRLYPFDHLGGLGVGPTLLPAPIQPAAVLVPALLLRPGAVRRLTQRRRRPAA
ncbi:MAG: hypothetical protein NVSMB29_08050 [Candidatus Dormibacteria bacterium]